MSDQVIAEIERSMAEFGERLGQPCMLIYTGSKLWIASCTQLDIRFAGSDVMAVLREFDGKARQHVAQSEMLARTLGLEAAE